VPVDVIHMRQVETHVQRITPAVASTRKEGGPVNMTLRRPWHDPDRLSQTIKTRSPTTHTVLRTRRRTGHDAGGLARRAVVAARASASVSADPAVTGAPLTQGPRPASPPLLGPRLHGIRPAQHSPGWWCGWPLSRLRPPSAGTESPAPDICLDGGGSCARTRLTGHMTGRLRRTSRPTPARQHLGSRPRPDLLF
jgi:hypothetical protein